MSKTRQFFKKVRPHLPMMGFMGLTTYAATHLMLRHQDTIEGKDSFSQHTQEQHKKNLFSGMHKPFMPNKSQKEMFDKYFPHFSHLIPNSLEELESKQERKTPVHIKPWSKIPFEALGAPEITTLVVGGMPALMSAVSIAKQDPNLVYIQDTKRIPISYGSAWHIEEDAESEAPTSFRPSQFMAQQMKRAAFGYVSFNSIEKTGLYPWRTLDWIGWITHPMSWAVGIRVALAFQAATTPAPKARLAMLQQLAKQCKANENFYVKLNEEMGGKLLLPGKGGLIIARNADEVADLRTMEKNLEKEGRVLQFFTREEMQTRYGFVPQGLMFAEKTHDRVMSPEANKFLTQHITKLGAKVVDGTLTTIYKDDDHDNGMAEYTTRDGDTKYFYFKRVILSPGNQPIIGTNNKPLYEVVDATGASGLAFVETPIHYKMPRVMVCGGTNHVSQISDEPISIVDEEGNLKHLHLSRLTSSACIRPNVSEKSAVKYDGTTGFGLVKSLQDTLGPQFKVTPIYVRGCGRQVSANGQTAWMEPLPNVHVQYGAGGGGLTRAPDFAIELAEKAEKAEKAENTTSNMRLK